MINGKCVSNLDSFKDWEQWPTLFCEVPRKGQRVENVHGGVLYVQNVTHTMREFENRATRMVEPTPFILVELGKI